jgi:hypothetical protein
LRVPQLHQDWNGIEIAEYLDREEDRSDTTTLDDLHQIRSLLIVVNAIITPPRGFPR